MAEYCMKCMMPIEGKEVCVHCGYGGDYAAVPHRLAPGTILIDRYLIGNAIGQGGFGITYMARDLRLNMRVAVKEYYPNGYTNRNTAVSSEITIADREAANFIEEGKKKFLSEARVLAQFHEERGVVEVRDFFEANQTAYIVMEYLDGQDLRKYLKQSLFTADEVFEIMWPVMDALEKIHEVGVVHRDISPDNIMLLKNGSVKLMDFGAARLLDLSDQRSVSVVLKAGYAPEEQYRPKGKQGPWTDVYALCATIYKCITGITPDDALERTHKDELRWPSELGIAITVLQEDVLKKGLAVKYEDRFQNISQMKAMLRNGASVHSIEFETNEDDEATVYIPRENKQQPPVSHTNHTLRAVLGGIAAVAVIGGAVWFSGRKTEVTESDVNLNIEQTTEQSTIAAEQEANEAIQTEDAIHLILAAGTGSSVKGFHESVETLRKRLEIFAGEKSFELEVVDDKVDIRIPKECLGEYDLYTMLRCYLTRATHLYAFRKSEDVNYNPEKFALSRDDLAEVTRIEGTIEGLEPSEYGVDTETYPYLKIVLTDSCAEKYRKEIQEWGDEFTFAQDMETDNYYYFYTFAEGDGKTFYVFNKDLEGPCFDLMHYNLTHDPLESSFSFWIDLSYRAEWDDIETAELVGENQCNVDMIEGETLTAYFTCYQGELSAGTLLDTETIFKARLDALDQPYAFGWEDVEGQSVIAIKTGVEHMGSPILGMLGSTYGVRLRSDLLEKTLYYTDQHEMSYEKADDGTYRVRLQLNSHDAEQTIQGLTAHLEDNGGGELLLLLNGNAFLSAYVEQTTSGNELVFDQVYLPQKGPITEETLWAAKFVEAVLCGSGLPNNYSCSRDNYFLFSDDPTEVETVKFGVSYDYLGEEIEKRLGDKITEDVEVWIDGDALKVQYNLEVNETLPEEVLRIGRETYEKSGFEESIFQQLFICFIEENNEEKERVRVIFDKMYGQYGTEGSQAYIYAHGIFANGRAARYVESFQKLKQADAFYQNMDHDNGFGLENWTYN